MAKGQAAIMAVPQRMMLRPGSGAESINVGSSERVASMLIGGSLACYGLTRSSLAGIGLALVGGSLVYRGLSGHCACYEALNLSTAEPVGPATSVRAGEGVKVEAAITIQRPASELYQFWRNFENLPKIMSHLVSVRTDGGRLSHWTAQAPLGMTLQWDAEIHNEKPSKLIAWRSVEGSQVDTAGSVHFNPAPSGRGTQVRVSLKYDPPGGKPAAALAKLMGQDAETQIKEDLRRFKQRMESGKVVPGRATAHAATH